MLPSYSPANNYDSFYSDFHSRIMTDVSSINTKVNIDFEVITGQTKVVCLRINFSDRKHADQFVKVNNLKSKTTSGLKNVQTHDSKSCIYLEDDEIRDYYKKKWLQAPTFKLIEGDTYNPHIRHRPTTSSAPSAEDLVALNLIQKDRGLVKVIDSHPKHLGLTEKDLNYNLKQLCNPTEERPSRAAHLFKVPRASLTGKTQKKYNPQTKAFENYTFVDPRKKTRPYAHIKKTSTTLLPTNPQHMDLFTTGVIFLWDLDKTDLKKGKYVYPTNAGTDSGFYVENLQGSPRYYCKVDTTTVTAIIQTNANASSNNRIKWNEICACPPGGAPAAIGTRSNDILDKLWTLRVMYKVKAEVEAEASKQVKLPDISVLIFPTDAASYPYYHTDRLYDVLEVLEENDSSSSAYQLLMHKENGSSVLQKILDSSIEHVPTEHNQLIDDLESVISQYHSSVKLNLKLRNQFAKAYENGTLLARQQKENPAIFAREVTTFLSTNIVQRNTQSDYHIIHYLIDQSRWNEADAFIATAKIDRLFDEEKIVVLANLILQKKISSSSHLLRLIPPVNSFDFPKKLESILLNTRSTPTDKRTLFLYYCGQHFSKMDSVAIDELIIRLLTTCSFQIADTRINILNEAITLFADGKNFLNGDKSNTFLHNVIRARLPKCVNIASKFALKVLAPNSIGETPISIALKTKQFNLVEILLENYPKELDSYKIPTSLLLSEEDISSAINTDELFHTYTKTVSLLGKTHFKALFNSAVKAQNILLLTKMIELLSTNVLAQLSDEEVYQVVRQLYGIEQSSSLYQSIAPILTKLLNSRDALKDDKLCLHLLNLASKHQKLDLCDLIISKRRLSTNPITSLFVEACSKNNPAIINLLLTRLASELEDYKLLHDGLIKLFKHKKISFEAIKIVLAKINNLNSSEDLNTLIVKKFIESDLTFLFEQPILKKYLLDNEKELIKLALQNKNVDLIYLIKLHKLKSFSINTVNLEDSNNTALLLAVADKDKTTVQGLCQDNNAFEKNSAGLTPFELALSMQQFEIAYYLLTKTENLDFAQISVNENTAKFIEWINNKYEFPLHHAYETKNTFLFKWLCVNGMDTQIANNHQHTIIELALSSGYYDIISIIIDKNPKNFNKEAKQALFYQLVTIGKFELATKLLKTIPAFNYVSNALDNNRTVLHYLAKSDFPAAKELLSECLTRERIGISSTDSENNTAMLLALRQNDLALATLLAEKAYAQLSSKDLNAFVCTATQKGKLPWDWVKTNLQLISANLADDTLILLLEKAIQNYPIIIKELYLLCNNSPQLIATLLQQFAKVGQWQNVETLLTLCDSIDLQLTAIPNSQQTLLHLAVEKKQNGIIKLIFNKAKVIDQSNSANETAFVFAAKQGDLELLHLFLQHKADVLSNTELNQVLVIAASQSPQKSWLEIVEDIVKLSQFKLDVDYKDSPNNNTALHYLTSNYRSDNQKKKTYLLILQRLMDNNNAGMIIANNNKKSKNPMAIAIDSCDIDDIDILTLYIGKINPSNCTLIEAGEWFLQLCQTNKLVAATALLKKITPDFTIKNIREEKTAFIHVLENMTSDRNVRSNLLIVLKEKIPNLDPLQIALDNQDHSVSIQDELITFINDNNWDDRKAADWLLSLSKQGKFEQVSAVLKKRPLTANISTVDINEILFTAIENTKDITNQKFLDLVKQLCILGADIYAFNKRSKNSSIDIINLAIKQVLENIPPNTTESHLNLLMTLLEHSQGVLRNEHDCQFKSDAAPIKQLFANANANVTTLLFDSAVKQKMPRLLQWCCLHDINTNSSQSVAEINTTVVAWDTAINKEINKRRPSADQITSVKTLLKHASFFPQKNVLFKTGVALANDPNNQNNSANAIAPLNQPQAIANGPVAAQQLLPPPLPTIEKTDNVQANRAVLLGYIDSTLKKATSLQNVLDLMKQIEKNTTSNNFLLKRQGLLSFSFWGSCWKNNELSDTGTKIYKLAKNRILDLLLANKIPQTDLPIAKQFLGEKRDRFAFLTTASETICTLHESPRPGSSLRAAHLLRKEQADMEEWLNDNYNSPAPGA